MILRAIAALILIALVSPTFAQESVRVGLMPVASNGAVFLAASRGYFKAEGLDVDLRGFASPEAVVQALAGGALDFGVAAFTATAFNLAGKGAITAVAAQARERRGYEGNEIVASNAAFEHGLRDYAKLGGKVIALNLLGSPFHYQLGQIARLKGFALDSVTLKPLQSFAAVARAVQEGRVDAAILPASYANDLLTASQAKLLGWYSDLDEPQLGALFTTGALIAAQRPTVEKFVGAYRRGVADYAKALLRHTRFGKRVHDDESNAAAALIARYIHPGSGGVHAVEASAYFVDPRARIDMSDIARQIAWYKAQGMIGADVEATRTVDLSFTAGP